MARLEIGTVDWKVGFTWGFGCLSGGANFSSRPADLLGKLESWWRATSEYL
jgi:hypothetical protein